MARTTTTHETQPVEGDTITVTTTSHYQTKFINLIGIQTLQYQATAHATLINGPQN